MHIIRHISSMTLLLMAALAWAKDGFNEVVFINHTERPVQAHAIQPLATPIKSLVAPHSYSHPQPLVTIFTGGSLGAYWDFSGHMIKCEGVPTPNDKTLTIFFTLDHQIHSGQLNYFCSAESIAK